MVKLSIEDYYNKNKTFFNICTMNYPSPPNSENEEKKIQNTTFLCCSKNYSKYSNISISSNYMYISIIHFINYHFH